MFAFLGGLLKGAATLGTALFGGGNAAGTLAGLGQVAGGIAGLKNANKRDPTPAANILSQAQGVREASAKYGFNPLTLLQYGQTAGAMSGGGGAAPLASIQLLTDGLKDIGDVVSGDAARRRAADQLSLDMAKLKYDQARSGVVIAPASRVHAVGPGPSPLGRRAVTVAQDGSSPVRLAGGSLSVRPPPHPYTALNEMIPVQSSEGAQIMIKRGVADRLGIRPFGQMVGEDDETIMGEKAGEIASGVRSPGNIAHAFTAGTLRDLAQTGAERLLSPSSPKASGWFAVEPHEVKELEAQGYEIRQMKTGEYMAKVK